MAKTEKDPRWAEIERRLADDPKLAKVLESLERELVSVGDEPRQRLKVPYANATSVDNGDNSD